MLHIVDITENEYDSYIFNYKRHYVLTEDSKIVKNDYLVMRWDNNSIFFFVNDVEDSVCSLIPCHIEIDEISYVSRIENNEHDHDHDFYNLPFA